jgi:prevent-host-death family protein
MDIGVRELKDHLSEVLDRAEKGEIVRVTDRGRPKAIIGPLPGGDRIAQGIVEGWLTPGTGGPFPPVRRVKADMTVQEMLDEDRGE